MTDETFTDRQTGLRRGSREVETTADVAGMSGIQVGLLLGLVLINLLVLWFLWGLISAS